MSSAKSQRNCFRHGGFILSPKEAEVPFVSPTDLSAELSNEWIKIDENIQTDYNLINEDDICDEIRSKRRR